LWSLPDLEGNPTCPRKSWEQLMNWIPVSPGNPGFGACPVLYTGVKPENDNWDITLFLTFTLRAPGEGY